MVERKLVKIIPINKDMYKDIKNLAEFYEACGVVTKTQDEFGQTNYEPKIDVTMIGMNGNDCKALYDLLVQNNYRKGKYRHYNKEALKRMTSWEMLYYCPYYIDEKLSNEKDYIPSGELWLFEGWDKGGANESN